MKNMKRPVLICISAKLAWDGGKEVCLLKSGSVRNGFQTWLE